MLYQPAETVCAENLHQPEKHKKTQAGAESANYPFCTIDPNIGIVAVPDERLKLLGDMYQSKKVTPATMNSWI